MQDPNAKKRSQSKVNALNKYQEIFSTNSQWGKIEYRLQLSYANVSTSLKKVYSIVNSVKEAKFNSTHQNKVMLDFILNQSQLKTSEDFTSVCQKGLQDTMNLTYGHLEMGKIMKQNEDYYEVMICRAAVGKTFIFPNKNITQSIPYQQKPEQMTTDFDSLFIYDQQLVMNFFKQNYIIYKANENILPMYIVHFIINENKYRQLREKTMCELCEDNTAHKFCETEQAYFCTNCDQTHHQDKVSSRHKRTDLAEKPKVISFCPVHPGIKLQLFCLQCNRPLCVNCKIKGDHSSGEMLMHNLIRVTEKYNQTAKFLRQVDPRLQKKKQNLRALIDNAQSKLKEINRKSSQVQQQLYQIMQRALKQLETITKYKMSMLMSDHIQLKRQLDQIQWMEKYIKHEYDVLSPNDFLLSWERHMIFRNAAIENSYVTNKILPDMKVEGMLNVTTEEQSRHGDADRLQRLDEDSEKTKSNVFQKKDEKINSLFKNKINNDQKQMEPTAIKSKNNFLNLSILKHI